MGIESDTNDITWMRYALMLAHQAQEQGEVPVGAVLIKDNILLGEGFNCPITLNDPSAHAEIQALRMAAQTENNYRLPQTTLFVTLEPCAMCAGAIIQARVSRVVFAASDPRTGAAGSVFNILQNQALNHQTEIVSGVLSDESAELLRAFFKTRRQQRCAHKFLINFE